MGVKGLSRYVNENIRPQYKYWKLDRTKYKYLSLQDKNLKENEIFSTSVKNGKTPITIIIDANAYFYHLADDLNWFVYDNLNLICLLKKQLHLLMSIENLGKLLFVFDGVNIPLKNETEFDRRNNKINSIKEFHSQVVYSQIKPTNKNKPKMYTPSPLVHMTFIQFLLEIEKEYSCIEVKFSLLEADAYTAELANQYQGYVISNDSDFFIYKTPGYINVNSLVFPKDSIEYSDDPYDFIIKYELYTNQQILSHFNLTYDTLPIFASFCSNDYFKIDNYQKLKIHFKYYNKSYRSGCNAIAYFIYKNIVNFILDMKDRANVNTVSQLRGYDGLTPLQKAIIEQIILRKPKELTNALEQEFKINLINSVKQYQMSDSNNTTKICEGNYDESLKYNILSLNKNDVLNNYYSGKIYTQLMNVLLKNQFECIQYFEDVSKPNCWDITQDIRIKLYQLLFIRNSGQGNKETNSQIEEILRIASECRSRNVIISSSYSIRRVYDDTVENNFNEYLNIFQSNTSSIKSLPFFLIPAAASLRFLFKEKLKTNLYIFHNKDKVYSSSSNNVNNRLWTSSSKLPLHYYELEALLVSCILALTFSYFNIAFLPSHKPLPRYELTETEKSISKLSIKENIRENTARDRDNIYFNIAKNGGRSLQLKNHFSLENLQKNQRPFENAIQIYAEFESILIMNSYILQALKLNVDLPDFSSFFSMYHYQWEDAYYNLISFLKINKDENISSIIEHLFSLKDSSKIPKYYLDYLNHIYLIMFNAIVLKD